MYVISIEDKLFVHSITINNDGIIDCTVTDDVDYALKVDDVLQAVCLKRLLMSVDGMTMFMVKEVG